MNKPRILVTRRWPDEVESRLKDLYDVTLNETDIPFSGEQLKQALTQYDAILPTVTDSLNAEIFQTEPLRTQILGNFGVGFNHIDLEACKTRGITVTNTPDVLTDCTADIAMTLMLMIARRAGEGERHVRNGEWTGWRPTHMMGTKITGKTLGMIGFGRIAQAMAQKAHHGFGMPIIFYTPHPPGNELCQKLGASPRSSIEAVLREADFVALHCPGSKENHHLINAERLAMMKPEAFLINSARGNVVDNQALIQALKNKVIKGAGLDVYEGEPQLNPDFLSLENVVLLPHLGSATTETRIAMGNRVIENLQAFFKGEMPRDKVV